MMNSLKVPIAIRVTVERGHEMPLSNGNARVPKFSMLLKIYKFFGFLKKLWKIILKVIS